MKTQNLLFSDLEIVVAVLKVSVTVRLHVVDKSKSSFFLLKFHQKFNGETVSNGAYIIFVRHLNIFT